MLDIFPDTDRVMPKFHCSNSKWYSVVCMASMRLYACLTMSGPMNPWAQGKHANLSRGEAL